MNPKYRVWVLCLLVLVATFFMPVGFSLQPARALTGADVTITLITGDPSAAPRPLQKLVVDSNNCNGGDGPHAGYVGFAITISQAAR